ncbi:MAG: GAF domain-containing protein, partial [Acetobacteraceae bacterium]|nr:GAF domain-containing protein [Acetobacteraceae bacterium]
MSTPRRLLARLRELAARGTASLPELVRLVASELAAEVSSVYVMNPGDLLELAATQGLRAEAVGQTRLRVGEGIVGLVAATGHPLNLPDAQFHPGFAYRAETGEEPYASMLAVPVRRAGRTLGVLTVQTLTSRRFDIEEVETVETVAMLLAEMLAAGGASDAAEEGIVSTAPRRFAGTSLVPGIAIGQVVLRGGHHAPTRMLADDPEAELARFENAMEQSRQSIDALISERLPDGDEPREILEAYRLVAADAGLARRVTEAIRQGLSAEAAIHRVAGELRDRMRRIVDPYLRER